MTVSTHVLDMVTGEPAAGVPVRLERASAPPGVGGWVEAARGVTGSDGRLRDWVPAGRVEVGRYRLVFETGGGFFPEVVVVFEVADAARHLHIPLLLGPFGYTTYRGS